VIDVEPTREQAKLVAELSRQRCYLFRFGLAPIVVSGELVVVMHMVHLELWEADHSDIELVGPAHRVYTTALPSSREYLCPVSIASVSMCRFCDASRAR
jgi:hypothetical protein